MPRQPSARASKNLKASKYQIVLNWIRFNPLNFTILILICIALILYLSIVFKSNNEVQEIKIQTPQVNNSTVLLETQLEKQIVLIKKLEEHNLSLENNIKVLDKRIQANTEIIKRMCEYIWVITIDKKIAPRQCYPDYNWRREETNGN